MAVAQSHAGPLSLICVSARESSPVDDVVESKSETKKKRFHPFRNLRRIFRRKSRQLDVADAAAIQERVTRTLEPRCSSTGRLLEDESNNARRRSSSLAPGLSLSHDSVFNPEKTDSGHSSSDLENSSLSIPILIPTARFQAELADVVRRRIRDDSDDEDLGLPRSRCSSLAADFPDKERTVKSQSSCSEGSLLSTGSSLEDDLQFTGQVSDLDLKVTKHKLSHSAAKHKMAIRPRRNHGVPGAKRALPKSLTSLPATPEVNEDSGTFANGPIETPSPEPVSLPSLEPIPFGAPPSLPSPEVIPAALVTPTPLRPETWSKSASLPHGAALTGNVEPKVMRSLSSAGVTKVSDLLPTVPAKEELKLALDEFDSMGKKQEHSEKRQEMPRAPLSKSLTRSVERRQRIDPVDIPAGPTGFSRMRISYSTSPPKPTWPASSSPPKPIRTESKVELKVDSFAERTSQFTKNEPKVEPKLDSFAERTGLYIKNDSKLRRDSAKPPIQKSQSFHKDVPAPVYHFASSLPKSLGDEDSNKRLYLKNRNLGKCVRKEDKESLNAKLTKKSASLESIGSNTGSGGNLSAKSASSESVRSIVVTHEEPRYANLKNFLLKNYDQIHHGYENIEIIELVRKEKEQTEGTKNNQVIEDYYKPKKERKAEPEIAKASEERKMSLERPREFLERLKDDTDKSVDVAEKPKSPCENTLPEFMRVQLKEPKSNGKLVERRKSELLLTEEPDLSKQTTRSFRKQVSLQDATVVEPESRVKRPVSVQEVVSKDVELRPKPALHSKPGDNVVIVEKQDDVVLRKKSQSTEGEEPELMKVFARRSLKVKDDDKDGEEEGGKSRDSDKENDENVKDENKKIEEIRTPAISFKPAAPLKPVVTARNSIVSKFVRSLSESLPDEGKTMTEMKNKINGADKLPVSNGLVIDTSVVVSKKRPVDMKITAVKDVQKEAEKPVVVETKVLIKDSSLDKTMDSVKVGLDKSDDAEEIMDEPGFKRIQDRRAEWERRLQAAK